MKRRRKRKRRRRDEEQSLSPEPVRRPEPDEERDAAVSGRRSGGPELSPEHLQQMQRQYGNAYVQRYVSQQQAIQAKEDADDHKNQQPVDPEPYQFDGQVRLNSRGQLELDLEPAMDPKNMNVNEDALPALIKRWFGIGGMAIGEEMQTFAEQLVVQTDGRLQMTLGKEFIQAMMEMTDPEKVDTLDPDQPFGAQGLEAEAELVFNREMLEDLDLEGGSKFLASNKAQKAGVFLLVKVQGLFPSAEQGVEQAIVEGFFLLANEE